MFEIRPATAQRWDDVATVFGRRGGYGGCWCMFWRQTGKDFNEGCGEPNRDAFRSLIADGTEPGLLAYDDGAPIGWVAVAPRSEFGRILRSPTLRPRDGSDDETVWSLNCFVVRPDARGRGVARALIDGAVAFARERGATAVEAYPVVTEGRQVPDDELYTGALDWFTDAGFVIVEQRSERKIVVRRPL
jgi:GNAT superfamily N-acetyltransferase